MDGWIGRRLTVINRLDMIIPGSGAGQIWCLLCSGGWGYIKTINRSN